MIPPDYTALETRIAEIKARAEKATEGPWHPAHWPHESVDQMVDETAVALRKSGSTDLFGVWVNTEPPLFTAVTGNGPTSPENAAFIAHAREDIPFLLTELQRLQDEIERLKGEKNSKGETLAFVAELDQLAEHSRRLAITGKRVFGHADFGKPLEDDAMVYEKAARMLRAAHGVEEGLRDLTRYESDELDGSDGYFVRWSDVEALLVPDKGRKGGSA